MTPGQIVLIDWRDALPGSGEPNKVRPAILVGGKRIFGSGLPFQLAVPLTGESRLAIAGASLAIDPTPYNGCTKTCYALSWCVQSVPHARITQTRSRVATEELDEIRLQISACVS